MLIFSKLISAATCQDYNFEVLLGRKEGREGGDVKTLYKYYRSIAFHFFLKTILECTKKSSVLPLEHIFSNLENFFKKCGEGVYDKIFMYLIKKINAKRYILREPISVAI